MVLTRAGKNNIRVEAIRCDILGSKSLQEALRTLEQLEEQVECVFFNAARVAYSKLLELPAQEMGARP